MFYNWKYCSFYPNNFGASALKKLECHRTPTEVRMYSDRGTHVSRPRYTCIPTETRRLSKIFDIMRVA